MMVEDEERRMIYLDNAATSRAFCEVREEIDLYLGERFYNPSALYGHALAVKNSLEAARESIAKSFFVQKDEIVFTSCATESNNWVLNCARKYKKGNVVTTMGEHPSVYEAANMLLSKGIDVRFARLNPNGEVDKDDLFSKIDQETALVSIIHCSNETGAVNDLAKIVPKIRELAPKAIIHSDGVQAFCKIETNLKRLGLDLYSVSAHKVGGAKGVGALYIDKGLNLSPFIYGGGQERGLRSGTENVAGIIGFAKAVEVYQKKAQGSNIREIYVYMIEKLLSLGDVIINGESSINSKYIISASIKGIRGEILQHMLFDEGILIGLGSACSSKSKQNRVLSAIGRTGREIEGSIRISFSPETTLSEVALAAETILDKIRELRSRIGG